MRLKSLLGIALAIAFLAVGMWQAQSVAAWSGVNIVVRDSLNLEPWQWSGDVYLINQSTGDIAGVGVLEANGQVSILHGGDTGHPDLNCAAVGGCEQPLPGEIVEIIIDFECQVSGTLECPPANGTPDTFGELTYTQNSLALMLSRNIQTGTGPTSVALTSIGVSNVNNTALLLIIMVGLLFMMTATFIFIRRRSQYSA